MKSLSLRFTMLFGLLLPALPAWAGPNDFSFGVISHPLKAAADETALRDAIEESDADRLAFVVANGIKASDEPCSDKIYQRRKALLHGSKTGLIVSLAASDWAECRSEDGKSSANGKLNRVRDLFFSDDLTFDGSNIPVIRQSATAKFRSYVENARWQVGDTMFATINLPGNNNHYVSDAGRNSEFEDRLVANRDWLHRVFSYASRKKLAAIVFFCDGNPLAAASQGRGTRDGFSETRRHLIHFAEKFPGKVLLVHGQDENETAGTRRAIKWRKNLGELEAGSGWIKLTVDASDPDMFLVSDMPAQAVNHHH